MEEKKLTDEEIIHNLKYFGEEKLHRKEALDLIHRLQSEKKELKSIAEYQQGSNMERWRIIQEKDKTIAEQKAEIERLTEENEYLDMCGKQFLADYQKCEVERAELENQVDELKKERENVQKILYELGKCGNDKERYAVWVKLIKYCGVEVE